jgi:hypothetical protein
MTIKFSISKAPQQEFTKNIFNAAFSEEKCSDYQECTATNLDDESMWVAAWNVDPIECAYTGRSYGIDRDDNNQNIQEK